jgi:hypothetical protein
MTKATKSFHALEVGDVVAAHGTTLEVVAVMRNEPVWQSIHDTSAARTRTLVTFQDLQPELGLTYRGPWNSGLRSDIDQYYTLAD